MHCRYCKESSVGQTLVFVNSRLVSRGGLDRRPRGRELDFLRGMTEDDVWCGWCRWEGGGTWQGSLLCRWFGLLICVCVCVYVFVLLCAMCT